MTDVWEWVGSENPLHRDPEAIPLHPTLPIARHGTLAAHVRAMGRVSKALVPTYAEAWGLFPEQAESAVEPHLRAKGWTAPKLL